MAVAAEQHGGACLLRHAHHIAEFDDAMAARDNVRRHRRRGEPLVPGKIGLWQPDHDIDRIALLAAMRIPHGNPAEQRADGVVDIALLDPEVLQPVLVDRDAQAWPGMAVGIVDVDDIRHRGEHLLHLLRHRSARRRVRTVDLRQQGRQHGRTRRHLDYLEHRARGQRERL